MAVTRLQRKILKNRFRAQARKKSISRLIAQPPMPKVDVEAIKKEFAAKKAQNQA